MSISGCRRIVAAPGWAVLLLYACLSAALPAPARAAGLQEGSGEAAQEEAEESKQTGAAKAEDSRSDAARAHPAALAALGSMDLASFLAGMEADRLLLSEIRKQVPNERSEAEVYLKRLKDLAALSDPVRLVSKANRVLEQAPIFYDWLEKEFASPAERVSEYYVGGAQGFQVAFEEFQNTVLLTVINRLDIAARLLREIVPVPSD